MSNSTFTKLVTEILTHTEANEFGHGNQAIGDHLYDECSKKLLNSFCELKKVKGKLITVFYKGERDILSIDAQKHAIKITINAKYGKLIDKKALLRDVSKLGHWGNGDYQVKLDSTEHFDYLCEIIKQIY